MQIYESWFAGKCSVFSSSTGSLNFSIALFLQLLLQNATNVLSPLPPIPLNYLNQLVITCKCNCKYEPYNFRGDECNGVHGPLNANYHIYRQVDCSSKSLVLLGSHSSTIFPFAFCLLLFYAIATVFHNDGNMIYVMKRKPKPTYHTISTWYERNWPLMTL